ncbi:MAG: glucose-1-phosphate cytidylyltransferase, partial [Elusimicrobiota bacterium]|nr:glucose-1-phosphate cytidylyltransferase [Endomicrobiia bacterium]MDW8166219.1 glucose-1-phosphate cytidylyltransferase [Elusimicrobiota bacterium]
PMVEIGGKPILWHIMKIYSAFGFNDFIICLGYKGYIIKEYFANYFLHLSDVTIDLKENRIEYHLSDCEPWRVTLVDTGILTETGGRVKRVAKYIGAQTFMLTYGDCIGNVNIKELLNFHRTRGRLLTFTAVKFPCEYGILELSETEEVEITDPPQKKENWICGGFFVVEPEVLERLEGDDTDWDSILAELIKEQKVAVYKHYGFWYGVNTFKDVEYLEKLWNKGKFLWL